MLHWQSRVPPQPSETWPHPANVQVAGVHPQTFGVPPPPQVSNPVHVPQSSVPPQPSEIVPQFLPCAAQVVGVQQAPPKQTVPASQQVPLQQGSLPKQQSVGTPVEGHKLPPVARHAPHALTHAVNAD